MCKLHDQLIISEKNQKISNHENIKEQYDKRMMDIKNKNDDILIEIDRVTAYNEIISEKFMEIDKNLAESNQ